MDNPIVIPFDHGLSLCLLLCLFLVALHSADIVTKSYEYNFQSLLLMWWKTASGYDSEKWTWDVNNIVCNDWWYFEYTYT